MISTWGAPEIVEIACGSVNFQNRHADLVKMKLDYLLGTLLFIVNFKGKYNYSGMRFGNSTVKWII